MYSFAWAQVLPINPVCSPKTPSKVTLEPALATVMTVETGWVVTVLTEWHVVTVTVPPLFPQRLTPLSHCHHSYHSHHSWLSPLLRCTVPSQSLCSTFNQMATQLSFRQTDANLTNWTTWWHEHSLTQANEQFPHLLIKTNSKNFESKSPPGLKTVEKLGKSFEPDLHLHDWDEKINERDPSKI